MALSEVERKLLGKRLRALREAAGMSARMLGLRGGMATGSIWNMEKGSVPVSKSAMAKLAKPLGLTYEELEERLFNGMPKAQPPPGKVIKRRLRTW